MYERVSQRLEARSSTPMEVVAERPDPRGFRVFEYGEVAFEQIVERISHAEESVFVRAFLWRDDEAGRRLGEAILAAANRGVRVTIEKDRMAAVYEHAAGSCQSFFHTYVTPTQSMQAWVLRAVNKTRRTVKQRKGEPNPLAAAILGHENITVNHQRKRFDHSKLFVIDRRYLTLGSMGIGDNHLHEWVDVMVEIEGAEHVERLEQRVAGEVEFDPDRDVDFLVHNRQTAKKRHCPMLDQRLALIEAARVSLTIEMAYLGDRRFTTALLRAVQRGVQVTLVTAARADVLGNVNRHTCNTLMQRSGFSRNLRIILMPRMVHSKIMVVDHKITDIGSANFTALSHGVYDEVNLYAVDENLARSIERVVVDIHAQEGEEVARRLAYRRLAHGVERVVVAYQSRKGARLSTSQRQMPRAKMLELKRAERADARQKRQERREERLLERQERREERREERAQLREEKRAGRADKRRVKAEQRQNRTEAKRAQRADKRQQRADKKSRRLDAKQALRAGKQAAKRARKRAAKQGDKQTQRQSRADRRQERNVAKRELRQRRRERRLNKRQQRQKQRIRRNPRRR